MEVLSRDEGIGSFHLGPDFILGLERGGIGQAEGGKSVGRLDDGAFVEVKIEMGAEAERQGAESAFGHDELATARLVDGGDSLFERIGIVGLAVTDAAEIGEDKSVIGNGGQCRSDVLREGDVDGGARGVGGEERGGEGDGCEDRKGIIGAFHEARVIFQAGRSNDRDIRRVDEP